MPGEEYTVVNAKFVIVVDATGHQTGCAELNGEWISPEKYTASRSRVEAPGVMTRRRQ